MHPPVELDDLAARGRAAPQDAVHPGHAVVDPADPHPQVIGELLDERRSEDAPLLGGQQPLALGEVEIKALQHLVERPVGRSFGDADHQHAVVRLGVDAEVGLGELLPEIHDRPRHALGQLARRRADPRDLVGQPARDLERARQRPLRRLGDVVGRRCAERRGDEPAAGSPRTAPSAASRVARVASRARLGVTRVACGVARGVVEARERGDAGAVLAAQVGERRRHLLVAQARAPLPPRRARPRGRRARRPGAPPAPRRRARHARGRPPA